jgi:hypothetical protein
MTHSSESYNKYMYNFERGSSYMHNSQYIETPIIDSSKNSSVSVEETNVVTEEKTPIENTNYYPGFIIDPLSLIVKLAIVGKKAINTKISIINHNIIIHEPGWFQGIVRYYKNSTKQDLHHLESPIEAACSLYIVKTTYNLNRDRIISLFRNAFIGLEKLSKTYQYDSMVVLCINHYINIIHNAISMNSSSITNKEYEKYYNCFLYEKMNKIWSNDKMDIVLKLVECTNTNESSMPSLETFMNSIDSEVSHILDENANNNV